jgi:hypothetical protein
LGRPGRPERLGKARGVFGWGLGRGRGTGGGRSTAKRLGGGAMGLRRAIKHSREQYKGREGAGEVPYLKAGSGDSSVAAKARRRLWSTVADLGGCAENDGERGQSDSGRGRGNWSASRVADVGAELTVAEGTAELQRRRGNELGTAAVNGCGALACAQRGGGERGACRCATAGGGEGARGAGLTWPGAGRLRAPRATWARRPRQRAARAAVTRG